MNNLKLRKLVREINGTYPKCEECNGTGEGNLLLSKPPQKTDCKNCQGRGYNIPFEFGCQYRDTSNQLCIYLGGDYGKSFVTNLGVTVKYEELSDNKILGKPLQLRELLLALNNHQYNIMGERVYGIINNELIYTTCYVDEVIDKVCKLDLTKDPEDYPEETINKLIELLS